MLHHFDRWQLFALHRRLAILFAVIALFVFFLHLSAARAQGGESPGGSSADFFRNDRSGWQSPAHGRAKRQARRIARVRHAVFASAARRHGVPVRIALATVKLESGFRCRARGRAGELGPLQIKPATARGLGFRGPRSALNSCGAGLYWGMKHLALAWRRCGHAGLHNRGLAASCARTKYASRIAALARRL